MEQPRVWKSAVTGRYHRQSESRVYEAQVIQPGDVSGIEAITILDEVLGLAGPKFTLRNICRSVRMDDLTARVDVATGLTGQEKVPPMVEAEIAAESYTAVDFDLWKNVVHVVLSDEARRKASHDILSLHVSDAARDLARMENKQVKEVAEACTEKVSGTPYSDWGAVTGGVSDTNPFEAIQASLNYIEGKGFEPDFMALHQTLWSKFIQNTWVRDLVHAGVARISAEGGQFTLPGYPTVRIIVDYALTETPTGSVGPLVGSSTAPAIVLGEGPVEAARYRNEKAGYEAYVIRQYLEPQLVQNTAIDKICT